MADTPTIVRGDNAPLLQQIVYDFDPQRGWNVISEYRGASQVYMEQLAKQYAAAKIACRLTYREDTAVLEANDATQQYTLDVWQILGNEESRDIFSHPTVISICTDDQIAAIRYGINSLDTTQPVSGAIANIFSSSTVLSGIGGTNLAILEAFVGLYLRGTTEYRRQQYVLRHTTNCPNSWPANSSLAWPGNISSTNIQAIYTTASLIAEATNIASWILPLPPEMQYQIQHIAAPTAQANYQWGWLKGTSTTSSAANNRVDITTEYCLEQWSTILYPNVI